MISFVIFRFGVHKVFFRNFSEEIGHFSGEMCEEVDEYPAHFYDLKEELPRTLGLRLRYD
jgi:hypothetical protein